MRTVKTTVFGAAAGATIGFFWGAERILPDRDGGYRFTLVGPIIGLLVGACAGALWPRRP